MHEISPNHISYNPVFDEEFDGNVRFYPPARRLLELEIRPLHIAALGNVRGGGANQRIRSLRGVVRSAWGTPPGL